MLTIKTAIAIMLFLLFSAPSVGAGEEATNRNEGTIVTLWPLFDYRQSPRDGYSNLSILGPIFKLQQLGEERQLAIRPLFYETTHRKNETTSVDYFYPLASRETTPEANTFQILKLIQSNTFRKNEPKDQEKESMFFPFYISGNSKKYGPYVSFFPFYGDIYERFWRDEYHFFMFPLYGRTVKRGTTTRNYLYPFFSTTEGDNESGFQVWPLYGQSAKEGVYSKRFALWPFFFTEHSEMNTDNPTHKFSFLPLYAATDSPQRTSRSFLWPFFGYTDDLLHEQHEVDYLWPFWLTVRGSSKNETRILPFFSEQRRKEHLKRWYMWPLLKHEEINSPSYRQELDRILFFLYSDNREDWPKDNSDRRRTTLWPLFVFKNDTRGVKSLTIPAPVEPIFDREGIEKNWAPLWRVYQQRWHANGDSVVSLLWNLYWHEVREDAVAVELFPLVQFQSDSNKSDLKLLKGLIRYGNNSGVKNLHLLWLPFGINWGATVVDVKVEESVIPRSVQQ